jgi:hypothetical protein
MCIFLLVFFDLRVGWEGRGWTGEKRLCWMGDGLGNGVQEDKANYYVNRTGC